MSEPDSDAARMGGVGLRGTALRAGCCMGNDARANPIGQASLKSGCPLIAALLAPLMWHVGADPHCVHGSRMTWEDPLVATTLALSGPLLRVHPKFVNGTVEGPVTEDTCGRA